MNTRTTSVLICLAVLLGSTALSFASDAPKDASAIGYWASRINVTTWNDLMDRSEDQAIVPGTGRSSVASILGQPAQELSPDVWVFDNCQPDDQEAHAKGCDILLVTFEHDRVANLKFVNQVAAEVIAAHLKGAHPERYAMADRQ